LPAHTPTRPRHRGEPLHSQQIKVFLVLHVA
jgi:hypothetical protein